MDDTLRQRYSRQILFAGIGEEGQARLLEASAVVAGCGAIGAAAANLLVRAGVGRVRVIDRDFVEPSNLQRQTLFEESDARDALPKAVAAERRLSAVNSQVHVEGIVADINPKNVEELLGGFDVICDGTDNFETRFLVNDFAVKHRVPWIYAAAVGSYGLTMTVRPGVTACLACLLAGARDGAGMDETCDTIGVLGPIVNLVGVDGSGGGVEIIEWSCGGAQRAADFLRCVVGEISVGARGAGGGLSGVRARGVCAFGWRGAAAYHDVWARFGADS